MSRGYACGKEGKSIQMTPLPDADLARHRIEKSGIITQGVSPPILLHLPRLYWVACAPEGVQIDFTIYARRDGPCLERGGQVPALARSRGCRDGDTGRARRGAGCRSRADPRESAP